MEQRRFGVISGGRVKQFHRALCPACGSPEDRVRGFREWHRGLGGGWYLMDLDLIGYGIEDGSVRIRYIAEHSRVDHDDVDRAYFESRLSSYRVSLQVYRELSKRLGVPAYIVFSSKDTERFWIYDITAGIFFRDVSKPYSTGEMRTFLAGLNQAMDWGGVGRVAIASGGSAF